MPDASTSQLPPAFNRLAWANLGAQAAEQLSLAAVPMVAVLALNAGPGQIGLLGVAQTLPFLLMAIPLGLAADRGARARMLLGGEGLRVLTLVALLLATWLDGLSIALLAALGFLGAVGTVSFSVAAPALVPSMVPREALGQANGRLELARSVAFAGGPALAGALVAWAGGSGAFALAALLSASAVALLWRLAEPPQAPARPRHPLLELRDGARFVWGDALLRPMLVCGIIWNVSWFVLQAVYVPYAVRALGLGAGAVGATLACYGVGMVCGALLSRRVMSALPFGRAVQVGPVVSVAAAAAMVGTLVMPSGALAALSFFLFGAGPILWTITTTTLRQTLTPPALLGRATAIFLTVNAGARPIGAALGGALGATWSEAACLWLMLAGFTLQAALILASPLTQLRQLPAQAV